MPTGALSYQPAYSKSWALVIGIDKYQHAPPLSFARSDAEGVARVLIDRLGFPRVNVTLVTDKLATRKAIMTAFLKYASDPGIGPDDRILIFFAGHGHTVPGRRGETGFLVPVDGRIDRIATLIRWD